MMLFSFKKIFLSISLLLSFNYIFASNEQFSSCIASARHKGSSPYKSAVENQETARRNCIYKFIASLTFDQCLAVTSSMLTDGGKSSVSTICRENFIDSITFDQCIRAASYRDSSYYKSAVENKEAARRNCIYKFIDSLTFDQCLAVTSSMLTDGGKNSVSMICRENFIDSITFDQCIRAASYMSSGPYRSAAENRESARRKCLLLNGQDAVIPPSD